MLYNLLQNHLHVPAASYNADNFMTPANQYKYSSVIKLHSTFLLHLSLNCLNNNKTDRKW